MNEKQRDQLIRETLDQCLSGIDTMPSMRPMVAKQLEEGPKAKKRISLRRFAVPAVALALCVCLFVTGTQHLNPVLSIAGRRIVCGPDLWLYWHGFDTRERQADLRDFYEFPEQNAALPSRYGAEYVYVSSYERSSYEVDTKGLERIAEKIFENGEAAVYRLKPPEEITGEDLTE